MYTIPNSKALETTQVSYNWWMDQENVVYIHNEILLSHKKEWNPSSAAKWMDLEDIMWCEAKQTQKDKYCLFSLLCGNLKKVHLKVEQWLWGIGEGCELGEGWKKRGWIWSVHTVDMYRIIRLNSIKMHDLHTQ
jgi:hypothetical protein